MEVISFSRQVSVLIAKEIRLEWRLKYALGGIALYLLAVLFLIYLTFERMDDRVWPNINSHHNLNFRWAGIFFKSLCRLPPSAK